MIDACHIVPFSETYDDTISNGLSLCPNLHRAFDRGLVAISAEYKVITSSAFQESAEDYSIKKYEGAQIKLPPDKSRWPSIQNLEWHLKNRFVW